MITDVWIRHSIRRSPQPLNVCSEDVAVLSLENLDVIQTMVMLDNLCVWF